MHCGLWNMDHASCITRAIFFEIAVCRPQTRYIQYFEEGLDGSFVSAFKFGEKFAFFLITQTLPVENKLWPFHHSNSVRTSNSIREGLGWTFSYIYCIFVHPGLDSALLCVEMREKSIDKWNKWITWGATKSHMLDEKADGCSQCRVSLSFAVGETNCKQAR